MSAHLVSDVGDVFRALCNPKRLAVLMFLADGPAPARRIQQATGTPGEALRKHLMDLRKARLITRPHWRHGDVPYSLAEDRVRATAEEICILASGVPITIGRCPEVRT